MRQQSSIKVLACIVLAGLLMGMPAYLMLQSSIFSSGDNDIVVNGIDEYEINASLYKINMLEDSITTLTLSDYFPDGWSSLQVFTSGNFSYSHDYEIFQLQPIENWNGQEEIYLYAGYNILTSSSGLPDDDVPKPDVQPGTFFVYASFLVTVEPVNDRPVVLQGIDKAIHMSTLTTFYVLEIIDLNNIFTDVDSDLTFLSPNTNGYVYVNIVDNVFESVISANNVGTSSFTVTATDGEYSVDYEFLLQVEARESIDMLEDFTLEKDLSNYLSEYVYYDIEEPENIGAEMLMVRNPTVELVPDVNWYGRDKMALYTHYMPYHFFPPITLPISYNTIVPPLNLSEPPANPPIIPPVIRPPSIFSSEIENTDSIDTVVSTSAEEFGCFEFDLKVNGVNDAPEIISDSVYTIEMTEDSYFEMESGIDLADIFDDVDSSLTYSWSSDSGLVVPQIMDGKIHAVTSGSTIGHDSVTIVANDGEYVASKVMVFKVQEKGVLNVDEDNTVTQELDRIFDPQNQIMEISESAHISTLSNDELCTFIPESNWNGEESLAITTTPKVYSVNPPTTTPTILSIPELPSYPPSPYELFEFGYYEYDISVNPVNDEPVMLDIPSIIIDEDMSLLDAFNCNDYFSDIDSELVFTVQEMAASPKVDVTMDTNENVDIFSTENWFGTENLLVSATDGEFTLSQEVGINVLPVNDIPFVSEASDIIEAAEDTNVSINLGDYISDVDDALWFSCSYDENLTAVINETTWDVVFSPAKNWNGQSTVTVYGADSEAQVARNLVLDIAPVNDAPNVISMSEQSFNEDGSLNINLMSYFDDVDSELSFITYSGDNNLKCEAGQDNSLMLSSALQNWNGQGVLTMIATDGEYSIEQDILVNVLPVNDAPTARSGDKSLKMNEDSSLSMELGDMFQDVDGDILSYEFSSDEQMDLTYTGDGTLELRPVDNWYGHISLDIVASDGKSTATKTVSIDVESVNDLPVLSASIEPILAVPGETVTVDLSAYFSDIELSSLEFEIFGSENVIVTETDVSGVYQLTMPDDWEGTEAIGIRASDGVDTVESEMFISSTSVNPETIIQSVTAPASPMQSMFWLGVGMLVAVVSMVAVTTTRRQYAEKKAPAGSDSVF